MTGSVVLPRNQPRLNPPAGSPLWPGLTRSYLVTYIAGTNPADPWLDIGEDPDLDQLPITWGICRTNVRGWVRGGSEIFFLGDTRAQSDQSRYFLAARLVVEERIDHPEAVRQFGRRPNVILDELPSGAKLRNQVANYLDQHLAELQWADADKVRQRFAAGSWEPSEFTRRLDSADYIHAHWDSHENWPRRLASPFILGSPASNALAEPIPWTEIQTQAASLPPADQLRNASGQHPARRVRYPHELDVLREAIRSSPARHRT